MDKRKDCFTDLIGSVDNNSSKPENSNLADNQVIGSDGTIIDLGNNSNQSVNKVIKK